MHAEDEDTEAEVGRKVPRVSFREKGDAETVPRCGVCGKESVVELEIPGFCLARQVGELEQLAVRGSGGRRLARLRSVP